MKTLFDFHEETARKAELDNMGSSKERFSIGSVVTVRVIGIYDHFVEVGSEEDGHYLGAVHISRVRDVYIPDLREWFYINQIINVIVEDWNEAYKYQFRFKNVRQPNGLKTNTVIQAIITDSLDGDRKYTCKFVDFEGSGVVIAPKNYTIRIGGLLPVRIIDLKKDLAIAKL